MGCSESKIPSHNLNPYTQPHNAPIKLEGRVAMIVNPYSGGKQGAVRSEQVQKMLKADASALEVVVFETRYGGHAMEIARDNCWSFCAIICIGGDGTFHEVINGLLRGYLLKPSRVLPPVSVVPCGSGNTVAFDLGIVTVEQAVAAFLGRTTHAIDVLELTDPEDPARRSYRNMADGAGGGGGGGG
eukprot:CAMPEP_0203806540 /NCGR_PEP_ID=MMETSP0115-20131106/538_1 /ASSEMBLY_ACC=CAM_ASM_000227 /TAXON_ID=33651 /ORGANISM="Bicosoecid sp, Strain ms1" /LENGTH=185 /DNA_ID=CAMNT_0050715199 /DNA_START=18 /DNA_END=572 /DNA_ORIENTATION=+